MLNFAVNHFINFYKTSNLHPSLLREAREQYIDMANGGDGGKLYLPGEPTCREYNYPDFPDAFFQAVCDGMGWAWRH